MDRPSLRYDRWGAGSTADGPGLDVRFRSCYAPPVFSPESLRRDVESICFADGRTVGSQGHADAEATLLRRLKAIGCAPYRGDSIAMPFSTGGTGFVNLVGRIPGRKGEGKAPLLIGAHYDSVIAAPCADDNAAAVAISLAVAEVAAKERCFERDLVVALFDSEEPPYFQTESMGSNHFASHQMRPEGMHGVVILDLVGHDVPGLPGLESLVFVMGAESHADLRRVLCHAPPPPNLRVLPTLNAYVGDMSDHGAFRKRGVPYLFLSCGHWEHYHMPSDTPDRLIYEKMAGIVRLNLNFLEGMDSEPLTRSHSEETTCETLDLEIEAMREAFGPVLPSLLGMAGLRQLETREDMNGLVVALRSGLGL